MAARPLPSPTHGAHGASTRPRPAPHPGIWLNMHLQASPSLPARADEGVEVTRGLRLLFLLLSLLFLTQAYGKEILEAVRTTSPRAHTPGPGCPGRPTASWTPRGQTEPLWMRLGFQHTQCMEEPEAAEAAVQFLGHRLSPVLSHGPGRKDLSWYKITPPWLIRICVHTRVCREATGWRGSARRTPPRRLNDAPNW